MLRLRPALYPRRREGREAEQRIRPSYPLGLWTPGTGPFLALMLSPLVISAGLLPDLNFKVCEGSPHHVLAQQACVCCTRGLWEVLHLPVSGGAHGAASSWNLEQLRPGGVPREARVGIWIVPCEGGRPRPERDGLP